MSRAVEGAAGREAAAVRRARRAEARCVAGGPERAAVGVAALDGEPASPGGANWPRAANAPLSLRAANAPLSLRAANAPLSPRAVNAPPSARDAKAPLSVPAANAPPSAGAA
nr:hypothetical protein GCM10020092_001160 [Actinoplanes digitatis]